MVSFFRFFFFTTIDSRAIRNFSEARASPDKSELRGYCTQIEPATKRLHDQFIKKHGRKPTLEEFMAFEEPYCTRIEPVVLRCGCLDIMIEGADENFLAFRQYI